jgi:VanZ family protein
MRFFMLRTARIAAWLLAVTVTMLSVVPPWLRPGTDAPHIVEHFAALFVTGLAFGFGYDRRPVVVALALVLFAAAIEIAQIFVPGRHSRLSDFFVDVLAACAGVALAFVASRTRAKFPNVSAD